MTKSLTPCPSHLVPLITDITTFNAAYKAAKAADAVFVAVERVGRSWTVRADTLTALGHQVDDEVQVALSEAAVRLVASGELSSGSSPGPVHITLRGVADLERARELAAAVHAALLGDLVPLRHAVPIGGQIGS
ncbi:hypothetical protein ACFRAR_11425 [Kitasatospora sp. NPDC056651]|uniref:hypothetical protein n=1 Tax=Kitasatospora sp. NPDC056651 TaxID=3345892 RepID=UPI0036796DCA